MDQKKKRKQYGIARDMLVRFFAQILIYTVTLAVAASLCYLSFSRHIWYGGTFEYEILHFLHENWSLVFLLLLFLGCMFLASIHFLRFARTLNQITGAVSDLSAQRVTYVTLPVQLREVELELNQILSQMQQDRENAREAEQRKNDMIVYMAHDLKTPLTSVIGYLTLLNDEKEISAAVREKYLSIALHKSERLEDLINEFFEVTKYNFSTMTLTFTSVNLSIMLEQLLYEFEPIFREKGLTCEMDIAPELYVQCDVDQMERVFDNLFKNAYNYCYENTVVRVSLRADGIQHICLTVENSGKTIPPEKLSRIFDQFFRMDSSRNSGTGGSGLGLAIAKEIISLHHGTIRCDSADERIVFTVVLPVEFQKRLYVN